MIKIYKFNLLIFSVFFLSLLLFACSSVKNSIYKNDFQLTSQKAFSRDSSYSIHVPQGWFASFDNDCNCSDIFLVRQDLNAALSILQINYKTNSEFNLVKNKLINYSKIMKEAELKNKLIEIGKPEFFNIENIQCAAYQYYNNASLPIRTILYKFDNRYFELNAYVTESGLKNNLIPADLYNAQNTILETLTNN